MLPEKNTFRLGQRMTPFLLRQRQHVVADAPHIDSEGYNVNGTQDRDKRLWGKDNPGRVDNKR